MSIDDARPEEVPYSVMLPGRAGRGADGRSDGDVEGEPSELPDVRPIFYVSDE